MFLGEIEGGQYNALCPIKLLLVHALRVGAVAQRS
jgi:hypothetical protein